MMENPQVNKGIVMSGHAQIRDSAVASGDGASAHHTASAPLYTEAVLAAINELRRRLEDRGPASEGAPDSPGPFGSSTSSDTPLTPAQREQAQDEADAIVAELTGDQADVDGDRLNRRLARLRSLVAGATSLLALVNSAQESVRAIIGG